MVKGNEREERRLTVAAEAEGKGEEVMCGTTGNANQ
jgi:hypothetical protein